MVLKRTFLSFSQEDPSNFLFEVMAVYDDPYHRHGFLKASYVFSLKSDRKQVSLHYKNY